MRLRLKIVGNGIYWNSFLKLTQNCPSDPRRVLFQQNGNVIYRTRRKGVRMYLGIETTEQEGLHDFLAAFAEFLTQGDVTRFGYEFVSVE